MVITMEIAPLVINALRPSLAVLVPYIVRNLGAKQLREMVAKLRRAKFDDADIADDDQRIDPCWANGFQMISLHIHVSQLQVPTECTVMYGMGASLHFLCERACDRYMQH